MSDPYRTASPQVECCFVTFKSEFPDTDEGAGKFVTEVCRGIEKKSQEGWRPFGVEWRMRGSAALGWSYCLVMLQRNA